MKKIILIVSAVIIGLDIAIKSGLINALLMFLLLGIIPGTDYVVPANIMLLMISAVMCSMLLYATARDILRSILKYHIQQIRMTSKTSAL